MVDLELASHPGLRHRGAVEADYQFDGSVLKQSAQRPPDTHCIAGKWTARPITA